MSGNDWEGWEASEERREDEEKLGRFLPTNDEMVPEGADGVVWFFPQPPEGGLASVAGGVRVSTPKGRNVIVGVHPDTASTPEELEALGVRADEIMDDVEEQQEYIEHVRSWISILMGAAGRAMSGEDDETLWKIGVMLYDYEQSVRHAEGKGYSSKQWTLKSLLDMLPHFDDLEEIEHEGDEDE